MLFSSFLLHVVLTWLTWQCFCFNRPGLLGETKYEFAKTYCDVKFVQDDRGKTFRVFFQAKIVNILKTFSTLLILWFSIYSSFFFFFSLNRQGFLMVHACLRIMERPLFFYTDLLITLLIPAQMVFLCTPFTWVIIYMSACMLMHVCWSENNPNTFSDLSTLSFRNGMLQDFSKGTRLEELNVLLKQTVMVCSFSWTAYWGNSTCSQLQLLVSWNFCSVWAIKHLTIIIV